jgi:hypothetical protein
VGFKREWDVRQMFTVEFVTRWIACPIALGVLLSCGSSSPDNFNGTWRWTEQGIPLYTKVTVNITQNGSEVNGVSVENNAFQQCTVSGTVNGHVFEGSFAAPCNQSFTVTLSPDKGHLQGMLMGKNAGVVVTATLLPSA